MSALPPEFHLVSLAMRQPLRPRDRQQLAALAAQPMQWSVVLEGARRSRVKIPLLRGLIAARFPAPAKVLADLQRQERTNLRRSKDHVAEIQRVLEKMQQAGIRVLVLKGVVLSQLLYGDIAWRGMGDIDLLVPPQDFWAAFDVLAAAGYQPPQMDWSGQTRQNYQKCFKELHCRHMLTGHLVELHQRLTDNWYLLPVTFDQLWETRQVVTVSGASLPTLGPEVLCQFLLVHGAWHGWERLRWLDDFARAAMLAGPASVLAAARSQGRGALAQQAMVLAHHWLGYDWSGDVALEYRWSWRLRGVQGRFLSGGGWCAVGGWSHFVWHVWWRFYMFGLMSSVPYGLRQMRYALHNPEDWSLFRLPHGLRWLYVPLRTVGWAIRWWRQRKAAPETPPPIHGA